MITNIEYNRGGINMNLNNSKLVFIVSPSDEGDKSLETVKEVIGQLIKDDIKNRRNDIVYVSSLNTFNWMSDIVEKDDLINYNLKLLTVCQEVYVLPNYELDEICSQSLGIAKLLGLPITYL